MAKVKRLKLLLCPIKTHLFLFIFFVVCAEVIRSEGKRRRAARSVEQCEREIQRLQSSLVTLRSQIGDENSDLGGRDSNDEMLALPPHSDIKMRNIISK